jgi:enoyl-CoA hydratase
MEVSIMSEYTNLLFEKDNGIGIITINRLQSLNALNTTTLCELGALCDALSTDDSVRVVIITGAGNKSFVAGADINAMLPLTAMKGRAYGKIGQSVFHKIEHLPQPVIAAVNGFALGGGCELALACDIRIVAEKAKFGQPEVSLGITPGFGGTQRLPRLIGMGRAKELIYTGEIIDVAEAYRIGLVNKVVPLELLMETAMNLARKIMAKASIAVQLSKVAINQGLNMDLASGIAYEAEVFGLCFATEDQTEGMTAFLEKRKPIFTGK